MRTRLFRLSQGALGLACVVFWTFAYGYLSQLTVSNGYWVGTHPSQILLGTIIALGAFFGIGGIFLNISCMLTLKG